MTTNNDLNVGLARLIGLDPYLDGGVWWAADGEGNDAWLPDYRHSLDALFAPGGPVEYARNKGLLVNVGWGETLLYEGAVAHSGVLALDPVAVAESNDPAEALATALHEAFMKEQGQ